MEKSLLKKVSLTDACGTTDLELITLFRTISLYESRSQTLQIGRESSDDRLKRLKKVRAQRRNKPQQATRTTTDALLDIMTLNTDQHVMASSTEANHNIVESGRVNRAPPGSISTICDHLPLHDNEMFGTLGNHNLADDDESELSENFSDGVLSERDRTTEKTTVLFTSAAGPASVSSVTLNSHSSLFESGLQKMTGSSKPLNEVLETLSHLYNNETLETEIKDNNYKLVTRSDTIKFCKNERNADLKPAITTDFANVTMSNSEKAYSGSGSSGVRSPTDSEIHKLTIPFILDDRSQISRTEMELSLNMNWNNPNSEPSLLNRLQSASAISSSERFATWNAADGHLIGSSLHFVPTSLVKSFISEGHDRHRSVEPVQIELKINSFGETESLSVLAYDENESAIMTATKNSGETNSLASKPSQSDMNMSLECSADQNKNKSTPPKDKLETTTHPNLKRKKERRRIITLGKYLVKNQITPEISETKLTSKRIRLGQFQSFNSVQKPIRKKYVEASYTNYRQGTRKIRFKLRNQPLQKLNQSHILQDLTKNKNHQGQMRYPRNRSTKIAIQNAERIRLGLEEDELWKSLIKFQELYPSKPLSGLTARKAIQNSERIRRDAMENLVSRRAVISQESRFPNFVFEKNKILKTLFSFRRSKWSILGTKSNSSISGPSMTDCIFSEHTILPEMATHLSTNQSMNNFFYSKSGSKISSSDKISIPNILFGKPRKSKSDLSSSKTETESKDSNPSTRDINDKPISVSEESIIITVNSNPEIKTKLSFCSKMHIFKNFLSSRISKRPDSTSSSDSFRYRNQKSQDKNSQQNADRSELELILLHGYDSKTFQESECSAVNSETEPELTISAPHKKVFLRWTQSLKQALKKATSI